MALRLGGIYFFIKQAYKYSKMPQESRDMYSILTFLFLALSMIFLFISRLFVIISNEVDFNDGTQGSWVLEHYETLAMIQGFLRLTLSYLFQNLALFLNQQRWFTIILENETVASSMKRDRSQSLNLMLSQEMET